MAGFKILLVDDHELPVNTGWAFVNGALGERILFVKRSLYMHLGRPSPAVPGASRRRCLVELEDAAHP
jgi:hypothetical protein